MTQEKKCIKCQAIIPPKRLEIIPGCKTCVNCSSETPYRVITTVNGEGDHTWNDIQILSQEQYQTYEKLNKRSPKTWDDLDDI
jgi:hypothetical protein